GGGVMRRALAAGSALALSVTVLAAGPVAAHHCVYSGGAFICSGGDPTDPYHLNDPQVALERIGGANRFEAAANISATFWQPGEATTVYIANAATPDALTGGASVDGPILLVGYGDTVPAATLAEIARLAP